MLIAFSAVSAFPAPICMRSSETPVASCISSFLSVNRNASPISSVDGSQTERTTFQNDGNLNSSTENSGKQFVSALNTNVEFKKEKGKVWFHFTPSFRCNRVDETGTGSSETFRTGTFVNGSEKNTRRLSSSNNTGLNADVTFRELWGKKNRNLRLDINGNYGGIDEESDESSVLKTAAGVNAYALHYLLDSKSYGFGGSAQWTEPISEKWTLSASAELGWAKYNNNRDAFDANGRNDYYSSVSNNHYLTQLYGVTPDSPVQVWGGQLVYAWRPGLRYPERDLFQEFRH